MVLAQAVCRPDGPVLVGEGVALTDALIDRIHAAGIGTVWVEGNPLGAGGTVGNLKTVAGQLPFLFRRHSDNVFMMTLRNVLSRHFARKIADQEALEDAIIRKAREAAEEAARAAAEPAAPVAGNGHE